MIMTMPKLGHLMEEGIITEWLKQVGDVVGKGEIILQIETGKSVLPVEAPCDGTLTEIIAQPGDEVPVNEPVAVIV